MQNLQFKKSSNLLTKCCVFNIYKLTHFGTGGQVSIWGRTKTIGDMGPGLLLEVCSPLGSTGSGHV